MSGREEREDIDVGGNRWFPRVQRLARNTSPAMNGRPLRWTTHTRSAASTTSAIRPYATHVRARPEAPSFSPLVLPTLPHRAGRGWAPATPCYTVRTVSDDAPKSAFELAMQRLRQKDKEADVDARPLTDAQKAAIAEARQVYTAKTAEREILHQAALRKAGTREEVELLNENLRRDLERLASDRDRKIAEIRGEASP